MSGAFHNHANKIVLTGGPGGGKTTAADLFRREIGESIIVVPEAATLLFSGGFPRSKDPYAASASQSAIYHVQKNLEDVQAALYPDRSLLCDRGTVDSSIYWPEGPDSFFEEMETTLNAELNRYKAVVFFESAAVGNSSIEGGNPVRNESMEEAKALDEKLYKIWSAHPNFYHIPNEGSFFTKMEKSIKVLRDLLAGT